MPERPTQARLIRDGEVSSRELVEATLERIRRLDGELDAYRVVFEERALAEADQADARHAGGQDRPLLGVPVAIKDDADIAGEITAFGTGAYGEPKRADSDVVTRLREAGAVVVGKTNVPELTMWPWTVSPTWGAVATRGHATARRAARAAARPWPSRPECAASPWARTAAGRSATRRRCAACSASSPSVTASRSARTITTDGTG